MMCERIRFASYGQCMYDHRSKTQTVLNLTHYRTCNITGSAASPHDTTPCSPVILHADLHVTVIFRATWRMPERPNPCLSVFVVRAGRFAHHMKTAGKNICRLNDIHIFNRAGTQYDLRRCSRTDASTALAARVQNDAQVEGIQSPFAITEFTAKEIPFSSISVCDRQHCVRHGLPLQISGEISCTFVRMFSAYLPASYTLLCRTALPASSGGCPYHGGTCRSNKASTSRHAAAHPHLCRKYLRCRLPAVPASTAEYIHHHQIVR